MRKTGISRVFLFKVPIKSEMYYCGGIKKQIKKELKRNPVFKSRYKDNRGTWESRKLPPLLLFPNASYVKFIPVFPLGYFKYYHWQQQILTLDSASSCTTVLVVKSTRTVWSNLSSSRLFSISCQSILIMFPAAAYKEIIFCQQLRCLHSGISCVHMQE